MPDTPPSAISAPEQDPRIYFAAERTFLAWIRTGLALMGLGFAIARFGLFIRQLHISTSPHSTGSVPSAGSAFTGISLLVLGILVNVLGAVDYSLTIRALRAGKWIPGRISRMAVTLAMVLAILGAVMAIRLFLLG
ncbi:YidH family protein [Edaphobacter modestus]|uniref:Putative membrane protein n=1 Tax=Edaphobacter modestus TaxID=388466 RepID=A0A4Q7YWS6_9BACT|nr:DUF202 domain-containing protein [Edaphobacter modestus]RZU41519.1 putative membrane protein [Edaphobacter modestus]